MRKIKFTKAQTNGNDFVIINDSHEHYSSELVRQICNRKYGVGCDQLIFLTKTLAGFELVFYNQDGSYAAMCGNGSSASIRYINEKIDKSIKNFDLYVNGVLYKAEISEDSETSVYFPKPIIRDNEVTTGNHHKIFKIDDSEKVYDLAKQFPEFNLHFISDISKDNKIRVKTYERGVGWTLACGSGAVAVGAYMHSTTNLKTFELTQDGGISKIEILEQNVRLTTKPTLTFEGEFYEHKSDQS